MIKLKNLILEWEDEYGERHPKISKKDEAMSLSVISKWLLPRILKKYNWKARNHWGSNQISEDQARKLLRKLKFEPFTNGQEILYAVKLPEETLLFRIQKLAFRKETGDNDNRNSFTVGYYDFTEGRDWGELAWVSFHMNTLLSRGLPVDDEPGDFSPH